MGRRALLQAQPKHSILLRVEESRGSLTMPEVSEDAALLIAASWQAKTRLEEGDEETEVCNSTVVLVFAAFFIEANLASIIRLSNKEGDLAEYFNPRHPEKARPGLQDKLAWFCGQHEIVPVVPNRDDLKEVYPLLEARFDGFKEIRDFRNGVSHGHIDRRI